MTISRELYLFCDKIFFPVVNPGIKSTKKTVTVCVSGREKVNLAKIKPFGAENWPITSTDFKFSNCSNFFVFQVRVLIFGIRDCIKYEYAGENRVKDFKVLVVLLRD